MGYRKEKLCLCQETHGNWSLSAENDLDMVKKQNPKVPGDKAALLAVQAC